MKNLILILALMICSPMVMAEDSTITVNSDTIDQSIDKVGSVIEQMAAQLGVATDHFYPIMVKQQVIIGSIYLVFSIIPLIGFLYFAYSVLVAIKDKNDEIIGSVGFFTFVCFVLTIVVITTNI